MIIGRSGAGKSTLCLSLIALGAALIADDRTHIDVRDSGLWASRPKTLPALIEVRGVGLLNAPLQDAAPIELVIDLDHTETERLPPLRQFTRMGCAVPLLRKVEGIDFAGAIALMMRKGRSVP